MNFYKTKEHLKRKNLKQF
ncbi:hypothetical protein PFFVO_06223 [Plasmodium falciparum Vietnam Oak-Knoll (FVO)]|uniref:Uncharacterized protein n=1 Tax=Plasmodium falciparum Vietnam Oak-Knoll (FVO) TaxID=1036723 RepID=A0A024UVM3_PLAFA|nr:hypothetical protein PFFVO_06223 [Plasmodium falciparum Vietnam Oak-Knoll (FVO)]